MPSDTEVAEARRLIQTAMGVLQKAKKLLDPPLPDRYRQLPKPKRVWTDDELAGVSIQGGDFSVRVRNCLAGYLGSSSYDSTVNNLLELTQWSGAELLARKNFGAVSLREVQETLYTKYGRFLRGEGPDAA